MLHANVLRYGAAADLPEQIPLRAGPLDLVFEGGDLRYIRVRRSGREVLRRVYVAVRDRNWDTIAPQLANLQVESRGDSFSVSFDVTHRRGEIDFAWRGAISGDARGTVTFTMDGVARSTFLRNRIGFCVLHPAACAGAPARIEHVDGTSEASAFPTLIAPQSVVDGVIQPAHPFSEMRAVAHEVEPGLWAELRLAGEIFEMEDQRNWIDASFKTYGTPLRLPFPAEIRAGERVVQSVTLSLSGAEGASGRAGEQIAHEIAPSPSGALTLDIAPAAGGRPLPRIGLGLASHGQPLSPREVERLRAMRLSHLRADLRLGAPGWGETLRRAEGEARALGARLELALHLPPDDLAAERELSALAALLAEQRAQVAVFLAFREGEKWTDERDAALARRWLGGYGAPIGGGTNVYFTELNRGRPPAAPLDIVCYSINPQVHAFDNASLAETCEAIGATVASARALYPGRPLAVTPVTLRPRFNPNATGGTPALAPGELPPEVDARQMSLFGAAWTLGSLAALAQSGVERVTYYETTGWRGVMEVEGGSPLPEAFPSLPGAVFPLYHALADAAEPVDASVAPAASSDPLRVVGIALASGRTTRVLLASLGGQPQRVVIRGLGERARVCLLDETNAVEAMTDPEGFRARPGDELATPGGALELALLPYALARIDVIDGASP